MALAASPLASLKETFQIGIDLIRETELMISGVFGYN
jgi:hypothetical protein